MPITVSIDKQKNLITRIAQGNVSLEELIQAMEPALSQPGFLPGTKFLNDFRKLKHDFNSVEIRKISGLVSKYSEKLQNVKSAIVVPNQVYYGMMRMLQGYSCDSPLAIRIFYDIDQAKKWLEVE